MSDIREMLKRHEGVRNKPYKCTAGKNTIGVGHNFDANPLPDGIAAYLKEHGIITDIMIETLLSADIDTAIEDCRKLYPVFDTFSENRQNALIDFVFQVGLATAKKFINTNDLINREQWALAAINMRQSAWYSQVPKRAREIVTMIKEG